MIEKGIRRCILDVIRKSISIGPMESLMTRLTRGRLYGSAITKIVPNHYQYPAGSIRKVVRDGIHYRLDISDIVDWFVYYGFKEGSRTELYKLIGEGQVIVDVGANMGDVTMHASLLVKDSGKVIALEPDPLNYKRLQTNLSLNTFTNIQPFNTGAGNSAGSFTIHSVAPGNAGMNRILPEDSNVGDGREIILTTLDILCDDLSLGKVDLIKIDTEGFEMNVLSGAKRCIERFGPAFFIELDDENLRQQGSSARELVGFLEGFGYSCSNADDGKKVVQGNDFRNCHFDLIARKDKIQTRSTG